MITKFARLSVLLVGALAAAAAAQSITPMGGGETSAKVPPAEVVAGDVDQARDLFFVSDNKGEGKNPGLRLKVYERGADCEVSMVSPYKAFVAGEKVRFGVESNAKGYLYIVQKGTSGKYNVLFPNANINGGDNRITRGAEMVIPPPPGPKATDAQRQTAWLAFDARPGVEEIFFIFSRKKTDLLPYLVATMSPAQGSLEGLVLQAMQSREGSRDLVYSPAGSTATPTMSNTGGAWYQPVFAVNASSNGEFCILPVCLNHR